MCCTAVAITFMHGLCRNHDARRRRWGDPLAGAPKKIGPGVSCSVVGCKDVVIAKGYCALHYDRWKVRGDPLWEPVVIPEGSVRPDRGGYVLIKATGHSEASRGGGLWASQHRKVLADYLGRALRENENVHHINAHRHDNRIENLELWVVSQPSARPLIGAGNCDAIRCLSKPPAWRACAEILASGLKRRLAASDRRSGIENRNRPSRLRRRKVRRPASG